MAIKFGTRELFLKKRPRRVEPVTMPADYPDPEIAGTRYLVQAMTADEKADFDQQFLSRKGRLLPGRTKQLRLRLVIATVVDETGKPLFTAADMSALGVTDTGLIDALVSKAQELNSFSDADLEDAEKN